MATKYYYADASGDNDGSSEANAWTNLETAMEGIAGGDILYLKKSGSRVALAASSTANMVTQSDTATTIVEGYGTTPGDGIQWQGGGNAYHVTINSGGNVVFKNIDYESSSASYTWSNNNAIDHAFYINCRFVNTNTSDGCEALNCRFNSHYINCYFEASQTATDNGVVYITANDGASFYGCVFRGNRGIYAVNSGYNSPIVVRNCIFTDGTATPMVIGMDVDLLNSANEVIIFDVSESTFYGFGTDAIAIRELAGGDQPYSIVTIQNNIFYGTSATNAINIEDADDTTGIFMVGNAYGGVTNQINGAGTNVQNLNATSLTADPFVNGPAMDFRLGGSTSGVACKRTAYPETYQGVTGNSERSLGAFQAQQEETISIF